jgi:dihydrofolate reductase
MDSMQIALIAALDQKRAIGYQNQLLWHLPKDLQYFKQMTWAMPVVMGRKTFESLSGKALPGRFNIVVTRQMNWEAPGVQVVHSLPAAIDLAEANGYKKLFVIGGGEIYAAALPLANELCITRVEANLPADSYFPNWDGQGWVQTKNDFVPADAKNKYDLRFQIWKRP